MAWLEGVRKGVSLCLGLWRGDAELRLLVLRSQCFVPWSHLVTLEPSGDAGVRLFVPNSLLNKRFERFTKQAEIVRCETFGVGSMRIAGHVDSGWLSLGYGGLRYDRKEGIHTIGSEIEQQIRKCFLFKPSAPAATALPSQTPQ
jgi:hypothetical protein